MLRRRDFPRIRENITLPECCREAALWQTLWEKNLSDFEEVFQSGAYHNLLCIVLQAKALKALLDGDDTLAEETVTAVLRLCAGYDPLSDNLMKARFGGHVVHTCALCYDWYGCEHHYNYLCRTYAHNCLTVSDPAKNGTTVPFWGKPASLRYGTL